MHSRFLNPLPLSRDYSRGWDSGFAGGCVIGGLVVLFVSAVFVSLVAPDRPAPPTCKEPSHVTSNREGPSPRR